MPPYMEAINDWAQLILTLGAVIALIKSVGKTAAGPNKTQDARLDALEVRVDGIDKRLDEGNGHFDRIDKGNRITQEALLAIMDHELDGNSVDKLEQAKDKLQSYLIEK